MLMVPEEPHLGQVTLIGLLEEVMVMGDLHLGHLMTFPGPPGGGAPDFAGGLAPGLGGGPPGFAGGLAPGFPFAGGVMGLSPGFGGLPLGGA